MSLSDPIADMLTRIRNAGRVQKRQTEIRASKICEGVAGVLKEEGYIMDYDRIDDGKQGLLRVFLKYNIHYVRYTVDKKRKNKYKIIMMGRKMPTCQQF